MEAMKTCSLSLLLLATTVHAQTVPNAQRVSQLNADLMALRSLPALPAGTTLPDPLTTKGADGVALMRSPSPDQERAIARLQGDLFSLTQQRYAEIDKFKPGESPWMKTFQPLSGGWEVAYALTNVLAGKELSDTALTPLTSAMLEMMDSALDSLSNETNLQDSADFRTSVEHAYKALLALGVSSPNVQVVMEALFRRADGLSKYSPRLTYK
jgi:hypothetical protein